MIMTRIFVLERFSYPRKQSFSPFLYNLLTVFVPARRCQPFPLRSEKFVRFFCSRFSSFSVDLLFSQVFMAVMVGHAWRFRVVPVVFLCSGERGWTPRSWRGEGGFRKGWFSVAHFSCAKCPWAKGGGVIYVLDRWDPEVGRAARAVIQTPYAICGGGCSGSLRNSP